MSSALTVLDSGVRRNDGKPILHGLPPVIDQRARVLILGSFPSTASLAALQESAPALRRICCNGRTAARRIREVEALGFEAVVLPSTSPANAGWSFARKLQAWRAALA